MSITSSLRHSVVALVALTAFHAAGAGAADASQGLWQNTQAVPLPAGAPEVSLYRPLRLDLERMRTLLSAARHSSTAVTLSIPRPDGAYSEFLLVDSRMMPAALQDKYPGIVSLAGSDADGRKARVDISALGFQAMVFDRDGVWVVRPELYGSGDRYLSFRRGDLTVPGQGFQCDVHGDALDPSGSHLLSQPAPMTQTGATERVYRAAVAANHQYVAAVGGGTVPGGLAAIVLAMNRVDQVYETELGVHMENRTRAPIRTGTRSTPTRTLDPALRRSTAQAAPASPCAPATGPCASAAGAVARKRRASGNSSRSRADARRI